MAVGARRVRLSTVFCAVALALVSGLTAAPPSSAEEYKMLGCSGTARDPFYTIENNTTSPQNPAGIFNFYNWCGGAGGDPPGNSAFLRIEENQANGFAGNGAKLVFNFDTPNQFIHFRSAGAYTRQPASFNEGWRSRLLISGGSAGGRELVSQGSGLCNCGTQWATTGSFASHLWPLGGYLDFTRFTWEMVCMRYGDCDRAGVNIADLNGMVFILSDEYRSAVNLIALDQPFMSGSWVRGGQTVAFNWTELGSGMKLEQVRVDGAVRNEINHNCDVGWSGTNGEYARVYQPCDTAPDIKRYFALDTNTLSDGAHTVAACTQDYAQWTTGDGSSGESCDSRVVHTDNTAPGAPTGLHVSSANMSRYLPAMQATFGLPPNQGSPIVRVLYQLVDAAGNAVGPVGAYAGTNPSQIPTVAGPATGGDYRLRVWLEDAVGFTGPAAEAAVPRDVSPPAAPQELRAVGPRAWGPARGYSLTWRNVPDAGSPVVAAHYVVVDAAGRAVAPAGVVRGQNVASLAELAVPARAGDYAVRLWLEDEEGNVGAAATAPLPRDTVAPAAPQGIAVTPSSLSRAQEGFDVRWRNVPDGGSPIAAAHYEVRDEAGRVVVTEQRIGAANVEAIEALQTPRPGGRYALRLWLEDAEGNVGVAATAPLAYDCVRSEVEGAKRLSSGFGDAETATETVKQGTGAIFTGRLSGDRGAPAGAAICVFSRVVTDAGWDFLGLAMTGSDGRFQFAVPAGPSRQVAVSYRSGARELSHQALLQTVVRPILKAKRKVVRNGGNARFQGWIPGPNNDRVVIVLQVRSGKGWLAFRRYRTRDNGRYSLRYHFRRTTRPTTYEMRAQVRETVGYPYLQGNSAPLRLHVVPGRRCSKRKCVKRPHKSGKHKKHAKHGKHTAGEKG